jgi:hypothetical protein
VGGDGQIVGSDHGTSALQLGADLLVSTFVAVDRQRF